MAGIDWYEIKHLESYTNVKSAVQQVVGRKPNSQISRHISGCFQQGRLFFESAPNYPLEIRPLLIYYGALGFAKALAMSKSVMGISSLARSHGIRETSSPNARIMNTEVSIDNKGNFQQFNDTIVNQNFEKHDEQYGKCTVTLDRNYATANELEGFKLKLKDVLSRQFEILREYYRAFNSRTNIFCYSLEKLNPSRDVFANPFETDITMLQFRLDKAFSTKGELIEFVKDLRSNNPFMTDWRFDRTSQYANEGMIYFRNCITDETQEFEGQINDEFGSFYSVFALKREGSKPAPDKTAKVIKLDIFRQDPPKNPNIKRIPFFDKMPSAINSDDNLTYVENALDGKYIADYSYKFLGLFLLSSIVRYSPQIWINTITRSSSADEPPDDRYLALIEKFMEVCLEGFPKFIYQRFMCIN